MLGMREGREGRGRSYIEIVSCVIETFLYGLEYAGGLIGEYGCTGTLPRAAKAVLGYGSGAGYTEWCYI